MFGITLPAIKRNGTPPGEPVGPPVALHVGPHVWSSPPAPAKMKAIGNPPPIGAWTHGGAVFRPAPGECRGPARGGSAYAGASPWPSPGGRRGPGARHVPGQAAAPLGITR